MGYAPLWVKSNYSFLEGASSPEELVEQAHHLGMPSVALTDRHGLYGVVHAHLRAQSLGMRLLIGSELHVRDICVDDVVSCDKPLDHDLSTLTFVTLAQRLDGYRNLCELITKGCLRAPKGGFLLHEHEIDALAAGLVFMLPWGWQLHRRWVSNSIALTHQLLAWRERWGSLYLLEQRHQQLDQTSYQASLNACLARTQIPLLAGNEVLYHHPMRRALQDTLTCIRYGKKLTDAGRLLRANDQHTLQPIAVMQKLFHDRPEALEQTVALAQSCSFSLGELRYRYPGESLPQRLSAADWLRQLTFDGAAKRYDGLVPTAVARQLEHELALIKELDYAGYFLTMWEIVQYCQTHGILCQGRGSAANSAVCFCLGITAIDPVQMDLLFERFLSKERPDPPDIDLDIEHQRREEVIAHVYQKYGRDRAAMVANVVRYRMRSAIRDVGKTLGLAQTSLDQLAKLVSHYDVDHRVAEAEDTQPNTPPSGWGAMFRHAGLDPHATVCKLLIARVAELIDFPRHLSIHPGGFLLGDEPVYRIVPIENGTMKGRTVIQWDKEAIEALGLFKVDLLGLGALTVVHEAFELIRSSKQLALELASIPIDDPATYAMMRRADTVGVFQIESRAQMSMLPRLRPERFYDLVIEISIVRPGPIAGDMVHPYLRRRHGEEAVTYPHAFLKPVLSKTLGVPLFQEQVIKLAMVAADYTPGEADQLRRDMAAWRQSGRIERHQERLIDRMERKGIERAFALRIFDQIRGFGEYGFPESHAASFALIAYATAWLKCHHPDAFVCALLNAQPMGFYSPATLIEDGKRHEVAFRPIDVCHSDWHCGLEPLASPPLDDDALPLPRRAVRMGLRYVSGFSQQAAHELLQARTSSPFTDLTDMVARVNLRQDYWLALAECGAFDSFGLTRRDALWSLRALLKRRDETLPIERTPSQQRFAALSLAETLSWDFKASSHSVRGHPLTPLRGTLQRRGFVNAKQLAGLAHGRRAHYAGIVICRQQPQTAGGVTFMTLEDETGLVNLVLWRAIFERYGLCAKTESFLAVAGVIQREHSVVHLVADRLWPASLSSADKIDKLPPSRDFH